MEKDTIIINGKEAILTYRQSRSRQKKEPKIYKPSVMNTLELLLQGDRSRKYGKGITTLKAFSTMEGNNMLNDTRVSNAVVELRKVIPKSGLLTFRYLNEKRDKYAIINDKNIIDFADALLADIKRELSLKL